MLRHVGLIKVMVDYWGLLSLDDMNFSVEGPPTYCVGTTKGRLEPQVVPAGNGLVSQARRGLASERPTAQSVYCVTSLRSPVRSRVPGS